MEEENTRTKAYVHDDITFRCIYPDKQTTEEELEIITNLIYNILNTYQLDKGA